LAASYSQQRFSTIPWPTRASEIESEYFIGYVPHAIRHPLLEYEEALASGAQLAGPFKFLAAFSNGTRGESPPKAATLLSVRWQKPVPNIAGPARRVRSANALSHSSQRRRTA
jgi:hypothetical protein